MRIFTRILIYFSLTILGLLLLLFLILTFENGEQEVTPVNLEGTNFEAKKVLFPTVDSSYYYTLQETYGKNKNLAPVFEWQCLLALSYYPELKEAPIDFVLMPTFLPFASRPDPLSLATPWANRKYLVVISTASTDFFEGILIHNLPLNELVGVIGHELAHTVYYLEKNAFELVQIAYKYETDNDYKIAFERDTDKRAIAHGLGYQLYDFAFYARKSFGDSLEEINASEGEMYLSPKEIAAEMEKYSFYRDSLNAPATYFRGDH